MNTLFYYHKFTVDLQKRWSVDDEGEVSDLLNVEILRVEANRIVELPWSIRYFGIRPGFALASVLGLLRRRLRDRGVRR